MATLHVVYARVSPSELVELLHQASATCPDLLDGAGELPCGCGAMVRVLGRTSRAVQSAVRTTWRAAPYSACQPDLRTG